MNPFDNLPPVSCGVSPFASWLASQSRGGDCKIALRVLRDRAWRLFQNRGFAEIAATGRVTAGRGLLVR